MSRRTKIIVALIYLTALPAIAWYWLDARSHQIDTGRLGTVDRDVVYSEIDGASLRMDIYHPLFGTRPAAAVLLIHGGAWLGGDKKFVEDETDVQPLLRNGFLVAAVDYRTAPQNRFPAPLEDVKAAVRFLRAHSGEYDIDPDRIGAMGRSAGGNLASLLGLTAGRPELEGQGGNQDESSSVPAVVDMFGPADLSSDAPGKALPMDLITPAFDTTDRQAEILQAASPVTYVSSSAPPFLTLQGDKDERVPPGQSQDFYQLLQDAGVRSQLVIVKNAGHEFVPVGGKASPSNSEISQMIVNFLKSALGDG